MGTSIGKEVQMIFKGQMSGRSLFSHQSPNVNYGLMFSSFNTGYVVCGDEVCKFPSSQVLSYMVHDEQWARLKVYKDYTGFESKRTGMCGFTIDQDAFVGMGYSAIKRSATFIDIIVLLILGSPR